MKINNIQSNKNFTGYYKLPNAEANVKFLNGILKPMADKYCYPVYMFKGNNPYSALYVHILEKSAAKNNAQVHWVRNNARNFNVDLPVENLDTIYVVTGKDTKKILDISENIIIKTMVNVLKDTVKEIFGIRSKNSVKGEPHHIKFLRFQENYYKANQIKFDKFMSDKSVHEVKNLHELLKLIAQEL